MLTSHPANIFCPEKKCPLMSAAYTSLLQTRLYHGSKHYEP